MRQPNCSCKVCSKSIYRRPSQLRLFKNVYCSRQCYRIGISLALKVCSICNREFRPAKSKAKFCSHSCANKSRRGSTYGKNAHVNHSRKRLAILRGTFNFGSCMVLGCGYNKTYDIHRLIAGRQGGRYEIGNMFAVCPNHHAEATRGLIKLEKVSDCQLRIVETGG